MSKDRAERKGYRKSPGRQYGYEHDPMRSRTGQAGQRIPTGQYETEQDEQKSKAATVLIQRPDLRRTRQLVRQNILAHKTRTTLDLSQQPETYQEETYAQREMPYEEDGEHVTYSRRLPSRSGQIASSRVAPPTRRLEPEDEVEDWRDVDPDLGYEDEEFADEDYDMDSSYAERYERYPSRSSALSPSQRERIPSRSSSSIRSRRPIEPEEYADEDYDETYYDDEDDARPVKPKKRKLTRRNLIVGLGAAAIAGTGIAAYEYGPKLPQAIGDAGSNLEHQIQDAFQRGLAQGADNARREILTALDNVEGVTLTGAQEAAKLTRVAYDVFVSPIVQFSASITGDVLSGMLTAFKTARGWLQRIYQDNDTLAAIQKVLETWVNQVNQLPKQLDAITQTDLDGAQAYLRGLQRKLNDEKAKLQNPPGTPAATTQPKQTATPAPTKQK